VAVQSRGLVEWIPDSKWERWFVEDFDNNSPMQTVSSSNRDIIAATRGNLYRLDPGGSRWIRYPKSTKECLSIFPLPEGGFLGVIRHLGLARLSPGGEVVEPLRPAPFNDNFFQVRQDTQGRRWVGHGNGPFLIEGRQGSYKLRHIALAAKTGYDAFVETGPDGTVWMGYQTGIARLDDQLHWRPLAIHPAVRNVISFIPPGTNGTEIWAAHGRGTRFSRILRSGDQWTVQDFTSAAGYASPVTRFVKRDSRGWIWRGSSDGVYVSDGRNFGPNDWLHIGPRNGLATTATRMVSFFEDRDGTVWITGEQGVTRLPPDPSWFDAPRDALPPAITRVEADGQVFPGGGTSLALPEETKVLRIDVGSLQTPPFRTKPFRYRLQPVSPDWRLSSDATLELRGLAEGGYTLEVGYSGNGPSAMLSLPIRVGPPPVRWNPGWLLALPGMAAFAALLAKSSTVRFRLRKTLFILRFWFRHRGEGSGDASQQVRDHKGEKLCGRYQVTNMVSSGGFSRLYEARDLHNSNARVALKFLQVGAGREGWIRDRFAQEVAALRSIEHAGVVRILDSWVSADGEPCLVMPFLEGPTLRAALQRGRIPADRAAPIIRLMGEALAEVHRRGVVHRDVKPENVILLEANDGERPVLVDFGTSGLRGPENDLAATTLLAGSFHYLAPERLTGHYSPASDVYAFGVTILEMLTGNRLSDLKAMFSDEEFVPELTHGLRSAAGADTAQMLAGCLAPAFHPEPKSRPRDAAAWAAEVAGLLEPGAIP
jgi:hypothetical protein